MTRIHWMNACIQIPVSHMNSETLENPGYGLPRTGAATLDVLRAGQPGDNAKGMAFIDLDGTLLGPEKLVSPENARAVERLRAAGFEIVIASGRHHQNILRMQDRIGPMDWVVSSQGAVVQHVKNNRILHELTLPTALALELMDFGRKSGLSLIGYHREGVFIEKESEWTDLYGQRCGWAPPLNDLVQLAGTGFQKVLLSASAARIDEIEGELLSKFGDRVYAVETEHEVIEFLSPKANKAAGAQALIDERGILRENTVAFGDGNNDIELLEWAGFSAAMGHGWEAAKRAATVVSAPGSAGTAFARGVDAVLELVAA
ncbi:MAG TPA: HAD family hydrolase [Chthoniobacterales bacterium]